MCVYEKIMEREVGGGSRGAVAKKNEKQEEEEQQQEEEEEEEAKTKKRKRTEKKKKKKTRDKEKDKTKTKKRTKNTKKRKKKRKRKKKEEKNKNKKGNEEEKEIFREVSPNTRIIKIGPILQEIPRNKRNANHQFQSSALFYQQWCCLTYCVKQHYANEFNAAFKMSEDKIYYFCPESIVKIANINSL